MECILFEKRFCFKPKYIHFVYSFVAYAAFFLVFAVRISLLLLLLFFFFFHEEHEDMPLS